MKRTALLGVALALVLAGCSSTPSAQAPAPAGSSAGAQTSAAGLADKDIVIAWISPDATTSTRWDTQDRPAFEAAVQQLARREGSVVHSIDRCGHDPGR